MKVPERIRETNKHSLFSNHLKFMTSKNKCVICDDKWQPLNIDFEHRNLHCKCAKLIFTDDYYIKWRAGEIKFDIIRKCKYFGNIT